MNNYWLQGKDTEPWEFWLDLEVPRSHYEDTELVDIAITGAVPQTS